MIISPYNHKGLSSDENAILQMLFEKLMKAQSPNRIRRQYYDGEQILRQLGIAVPREYQDIYTILGWPKLAVEALANRIHFEGIVSSGDSNPQGLQDIFTDNDMELETTLAVTSALKYGLSFLTVTSSPEHDSGVLINNRSALNTTVLWNRRLRRPDAGLTVFKTEEGVPESFVLYLPDVVIEVNEAGVFRTPNPTGRAPITVLRYQPDADEDKPLGRSLLTKSMMGLVDHASRVMSRTELNAELYSFPARYALNVADDALVD